MPVSQPYPTNIAIPNQSANWPNFEFQIFFVLTEVAIEAEYNDFIEPLKRVQSSENDHKSVAQ